MISSSRKMIQKVALSVALRGHFHCASNILQQLGITKQLLWSVGSSSPCSGSLCKFSFGGSGGRSREERV